ncbi:MAG TPA: hypothetical protein VE684_08770, partial [Crenalkalicoccus sp.]|nr:hypothetical protein [Crenalkalicoccus sp.]
MSPPLPAAALRPAAAPSFPLALAMLAAPVAVVLQSKAVAPIATVALLLVVLAHRRATGAWPWPRGTSAAAAIGVFAWGAATTLWSVDPLRSIYTSATMGGFVTLGAAAAQAVAADAPAARA